MVYLDYNSTTPVLPEVFEAMRPFFCDDWGNPSSAYRFGAKNKRTIEVARERVAGLVGADPEEIVFTSCATESNNSALLAALDVDPAKRHIVTSAVEHSSVLAHCRALERKGFRVTYLPVNRDGILSVADLRNSLTADTAVVSVLWANNETGVLCPVEEIAELCKERGVLFHCDAVQAVGKLEINLNRIPIDFVSISGHKFYAPKGVGALYIRRNTPFQPLLFGGHQENGRRGGTENLPLIVGMGKAAEIAMRCQPEFNAKVKLLRDRLEAEVLAEIANTEINGHLSFRLSNTANIAFRGVESDALLLMLDQIGICASKGSACLSNSDGPSHVIKAMKPDGLTARQSMRFSFGINSSAADVDVCVKALAKSVLLLRA